MDLRSSLAPRQNLCSWLEAIMFIYVPLLLPSILLLIIDWLCYSTFWAICICCGRAAAVRWTHFVEKGPRGISGVLKNHSTSRSCFCSNRRMLPAWHWLPHLGIPWLRMRGSLVEVKTSLDSLAYRLDDLAAREHALRAQEVARSGTNEGMSLPKNATCWQIFGNCQS